MTLGEQLDKIREDAKERIPAEMRALMQQATDELRQSGIMDRALKTGDSLPGFELPNMSGSTVAAKELLARGPLVITFYRGVW